MRKVFFDGATRTCISHLRVRPFQFDGCHGWLAHPCSHTAGQASSATRSPNHAVAFKNPRQATDGPPAHRFAGPTLLVQLEQNGGFFRVPLAAAKQTLNYREIRNSGQASAERSVVPHWPGRRSNHAIIQPLFRRPPVAHGNPSDTHYFAIVGLLRLKVS